MINPEFQQLKDEYRNCQRCQILVKNRTQVVFGAGNPQAEVLFIGEAPGANEDKEGLPFCGMSGKVLDSLLESINLSREDIFITNTILCRPPNNQPPAKDEVNNCHDRLKRLMAIMRPKVIVTIGNFATERILGRNGVTSLHGQVFEHQGIKVVPVIHPANYLYSGRNPKLLEQMKRDFQTIAAIISSAKTQKRLQEF
ncbi:uracil-DNA glycosylase [Candidatus Woesearchaeota archaeon]|nr:uracil-DNA glycosylase [Candidatus Woesearchaeota archaeon]